MSVSERGSDGEQIRAVRVHGAGDIRVDSVDASRLSGEGVRLRMRRVGICGSDLHYFTEGGTGANTPSSPLVLGHEIAAEVADENVESPGLSPGTLVAVDPALPCGTCEWCRKGHVNLCPHVKFKGAGTHPGGLSEYLWAAEHQIIPVPTDMGPTTAALLEPLGVAIHAVDLAEIRTADSVAVLGAGPIGLLLAQVAQNAGATSCFVIDPLGYRLEGAESLGADEVATTHEALEEWTDGRGVDVVLEATNSAVALDHAIESVRIGGRVVLVGIPEGDEYEMTPSEARRKGLTVKFSRRMGEVYSRAIQMVQTNRVDLGPLATHRVSLEEAPSAIAMQANYEDDVIKVMVSQDSVDGD